MPNNIVLEPLKIVSIETLIEPPMFNVVADENCDESQIASCKLADVPKCEGVSIKLIDPTKICISKFANRHELNFRADNFDKFVAEISSAGGNIQPIKVRPIENEKYEIVFGHRRHRACLHLGVPVLAIVEEISDQDLWIHMDRENRERKSPSMYELGLSYKSALKEKMFLSIRQLARATGISSGYVSRCIQAVDLPREIIDAFDTPMQINSQAIIAIEAALAKDREAVLSRARTAKENGVKTPKDVLNWLVDQKPIKKVIPFKKNDKKFATVAVKNGILTISSRHIDIAKAIEWIEALE